MDVIQKHLNEVDLASSMIGASIGAGLTAASWAKVKLKLKKAMDGCKTKKCREEIKKKSKALTKIAIAKGLARTGAAIGRGVSFANQKSKDKGKRK